VTDKHVFSHRVSSTRQESATARAEWVDGNDAQSHVRCDGDVVNPPRNDFSVHNFDETGNRHIDTPTLHCHFEH